MTRRFQHAALVAFLAILMVVQLASPTARAEDRSPAEEPAAGGAVAAQEDRPGPIREGPAALVASTSAGGLEQVGGGAAAEESEPVAEGAAAPAFMVLAGGTTVSPETFYSPILGKKTWYEVILPPGYAGGARRYPVLYMLHGAMGGASEWVEIGIHRAADQLWSEGEIEPFIIVLPEGGTLTYWLNHADGGPRYGDYLIEDVVREIDSKYRTLAAPEYRAVGGLSMGGDGALRLALTHPNVFSIAGAHSPTTRLRYEDRPGPFYGDFEYWQRNNSLWLIRNAGTADRLQIWIDVGWADPWVFSGRELHQALLDQGVEHYYAELDGGHDADYWVGHQDRYLRFYSAAFGGGSRLANQAVEAAGE